MVKKLALLALVAVLALSLLPGCLFRGCQRETAIGPRGPAEQYGGVWHGAIGSEPSTLDPAFAVTILDSSITSLLYNGLVRFDSSGAVVGDLAKEWKVSSDGLTYTFYLHQKVKFSNGRELTAADVKYTLERLADPATASPRSWVVSAVTGIETKGKYEVRIKLKEAHAPFLSLLAMPAGYIVDRQSVGRGGFPVGSGPFVLTEVVPNERLVFQVNKEYFAGRAFLDGIVYHIVGDSVEQAAMFEAGNLHSIKVSGGYVDRFRANQRYSSLMLSQPSLSVNYICLNTAVAPFNDVRVRQALNYAVDRQLLVDRFLPGQAVVANSPIPPGLLGEVSQATAYLHNINRAKELLREAGYPRGFTVDLIQRSTRNAVTQTIAEMLGKIGVKVRIRTLGKDEFFRAVGPSGDFQMAYLNWLADYPEASNFLWPLFHSANIGDGGNRARLTSQPLDSLIEQALATVDAAARTELYRQVEAKVIEEAPWVFLYHPVEWMVYQPEVRGMVPFLIPMADKMTDVWLAKKTS
ncbi:MAG: ABC transporter substrate-binding protein [Bacillota bacterium]